MKKKLLPGQRNFTPAERGIIDVNNRPVVPARRFTVDTLTKHLEHVKLNATHRGVEGGEQTAQWADEALNKIHEEDYMKSRGEMVLAASRGDAEAVEMLAAAVEIVTTNIIIADTCWVPFFKRGSLNPDEYLLMRSDVPNQKVAFQVVGQDGGRSTVFAQPDDPTPVHIPISMRSSPWIEYPFVDLYKGVVRDAALLQFDLARDRADREDLLARSYIVTSSADTRYIANFVTSGADAARDIKAHPNVVLANLPTGNLVTLTGNTDTSLFRKEVFDAIIEYCTSWGTNALEAGSFRPVEILVASKHKSDFLKQVAFKDVPGFLVTQVFETGFVMTYAGYTFVVNGINTISPTHGVAYVRMDQPIGEWWDKPAVADTIIDETPQLRTQNKGRMCEMWAESIVLPLHWRKRTLAVRYKNET